MKAMTRVNGWLVRFQGSNLASLSCLCKANEQRIRFFLVSTRVPVSDYGEGECACDDKDDDYPDDNTHGQTSISAIFIMMK
jgi:hypothetical protein